MEWKKLTCALLVAMLILGMAMISVGANPQLPKLSVDPPTYTATILGEVFTININVTNVHNLSGLEFKLGYNTTLLDAMPPIVAGPFLLNPVFAFPPTINETEGYVWVSIMCSPCDGNGTVATITFSTTYAGSASCALHLYDTELIDNKGGSINHEVEDGEYKFAILGVTVTTDKPFYNLGDNITIHGNLTLNNSPLQGLVALEVDDPTNLIIVARTLLTGAPPPPGNVTIIDVYPSNMWGDPQNSFSRGETAYFSVSIRNDGTVPVTVTITLNTYDTNMVPINAFGVEAVQMPLAHGTGGAIMPTWIPNWADLGNGTAYANVFTNWPKAGGVSYCPEKNATFQITGSSGGGAAMEPQGSGNDGNYSLTFKLPSNLGNYTVHVSASYRGTTTSTQVINSTTFKVQSMLRGDLNGDGKVTIADVKIMDNVYSEVDTDPEHVERADLNGDGKVTIADVKIMDNIYSGIL